MIRDILKCTLLLIEFSLAHCKGITHKEKHSSGLHQAQ
jgi:hypothetical protein